MPKTCKSNEVAQKYLMKFEVLALISDSFGFGFSSSGARVSNTWVICLGDWNNN